MSYNLRTGLAGVNINLSHLTASSVTSGVFDSARIPELAKTKIADAGAWQESEIPSLSATKITSGTLDAARIPELDKTKIDKADRDTKCKNWDTSFRMQYVFMTPEEQDGRTHRAKRKNRSCHFLNRSCQCGVTLAQQHELRVPQALLRALAGHAPPMHSTCRRLQNHGLAA